MPSPLPHASTSSHVASSTTSLKPARGIKAFFSCPSIQEAMSKEPTREELKASERRGEEGV